MEPICVYCGIRTAIVYCNVDFVRLCLQCDLTIHSANNSFSHITHPRSLLCNNCTLQPAILRCFEEDLCFCHDCVCMGNCLQLCHQFQKLRTYTGCPSMDDLTQDLESSCSVFYPTNDKLRCSSLPFNSGYVKESNGESSPSMPILQNLDYMTNCKDQQGALALDMDKDFQFNIIDSDDIFEWTQSYTECQPDQEAMNTDSVLVDSWITEISNCPAETIVEEAMTLSSSSSGDHHQEQKAAICSSRFSCDNNNNNTLHSSTIRLDCGSTTTNDYTSPWELNIEGGGNNKQEREAALKRYYAKKKKRTFGKQIRYASRKARADSRKRIQGRFVKAGEAYDYDPFTKETP